MKRWLSNGILGVLGLVGCVLWTGCGGGGGNHGLPSVTNLTYARTANAPGVILLQWSPAPGSALLGYSVRRRVAGETNFNLVTDHLVASPSYTDQLPDRSDTRTLYYQVIAVGANGQLSQPAEVTAIVTPPDPPAGF
jgi:hypothetical protein